MCCFILYPSQIVANSSNNFCGVNCGKNLKLYLIDQLSEQKASKENKVGLAEPNSS